MFQFRNKSSRRRRRGSAYVLVIGIALVVTVLGMAGLIAGRVQNRAVAAGCDWEESGTLATAAVEHAISYLNASATASPNTWRATFSNRQTSFTQTMGRGTFKWALKDETDGNLSASYLRPIRIFGIGQVGSTTRVYSVEVMPSGAPLDVLRTSLHSGGTMTLTGTINAPKGPLSCNGNISLSGTVNAPIEALTTSGSAAGVVSSVVPAPFKSMPTSATYLLYKANATSIPWSSLGNNIQPVLLTPSRNPYGRTDPNGLYSIVIPSGSNVQIKSSRIVGTLLISTSNSTITFVGPILWEPARPDYPILIVSASNSTINFQGSTTWLCEDDVNMNLNPSSAPFEGYSDSDTADDYPPQYRGLIHIIGSTNNVQLNANSYFVGTLVADGTIKTTGQCTAIQNPAIYNSPPIGYTSGNRLSIVPGSWQWDALP